MRIFNVDLRATSRRGLVLSGTSVSLDAAPRPPAPEATQSQPLFGSNPASHALNPTSWGLKLGVTDPYPPANDLPLRANTHHLPPPVVLRGDEGSGIRQWFDGPSQAIRLAYHAQDDVFA
ncbi:hypothetical protein PCL_07180 [Purpureocillium lilacinum]|uniref:Uncharacterized protein n=1 Tax=Purpureocillium lilacinum TaxID=33203 RepID=A0A2U3DT21_PURLI|nr:hypothetical protein PCL_07180 [Purpureocillium lilacinum]